MPSFAFILGREPHLSVAEIAAVVGDGADWTKAELSAEALVVSMRDVGEGFMPSRDSMGGDEPRPYDHELMARLGGTIKIGEVWREVPHDGFDGHDDTIGKFILNHTNDARKTHFGYSVYDFGAGTKRAVTIRQSLTRGAAAQKSWLKEHGRTVRWVTSREPTLSSVIVAKNRLLPDDNGVEVLVLVGSDRIVLARTLAVQPFEEWGRRDYGRPSRDARSGMLPPKLARAMVNIGAASCKLQAASFTLLDPFCGSGTTLTEAMALGIPRIIGTDVDAGAIRAAKENVQWLRRRMHHPHALPLPVGGGEKEGAGSMDIQIEQCDVRRLSQCVRERVDVIVTEPYLGPPRQLPASSSKLQALQGELRTLYVNAFREFAKVLKPGGRVVFIVPEFRRHYVPIRTNGRMRSGGPRRIEGVGTAIDVTRDVVRFGFQRVDPFPVPLREHGVLHGQRDLPYARLDQRVGRRILVFQSDPSRR